MKALLSKISTNCGLFVNHSAPVFSGRVASTIGRQLSVKWDIFENWKTAFDKSYETEQEEARRFGYFEKRYERTKKEFPDYLDNQFGMGMYIDLGPGDKNPYCGGRDGIKSRMSNPYMPEWSGRSRVGRRKLPMHDEFD